jgi:hypothetical protein
MDEKKIAATEGEAVAASAAYVFIAKEANAQEKKLSAEYIQRDEDSSEVLIYLAIGRQTEWYNIGIDEDNQATGGCFAISSPDDFQAIILKDTDVEAIWNAYDIEKFLASEYKPDPHMDEVVAVFSANREPSPDTIKRMSIGSQAILLEMLEHEKMDEERLKGRKLN